MRLHRLDGLRGVAALIVAIHHCLLSSAQLARPYFGDNAQGALATALVRTPLHLLWDGSAAVTIFFVLSGFVLTRATQNRSVRWLLFDAQRLVRLYLPAWAATALAIVFALVFSRDLYSGTSVWVAFHDVSIRSSLFDAFTLREGTGLITPVWSLKWEIIFSLALPLYLALGRALGWAWPAIPLVCASLAYLGVRTQHDVLIQLPVFLIGVVMAQRLDSITPWASRVGQGPLVGAALALIALPWAFELGFLHRLTITTLPVIGATLLLAACLVPGNLTAFLEKPWAQWLGRISFSLYLVHEPLAVSLAVLGLPPALVLLFGLPLSLALAAAFYRWVERPTHALARRIPAMSSRDARADTSAAT